MKIFRKRDSLAGGIWKVLGSVLLLFCIAFVVSTIIITGRIRLDAEIRQTEVLVNAVTGSITADIESYKDLSRLMMINENVVTFLREDELDLGLANDARFSVRETMNVSSSIDSVYVFRNDWDYMSTGAMEYFVDYDKMKDPEWSNEIMEKRGSAVIGINGNGAIVRKNGRAILTVSRAIYDIYTQKQTGLLLMNISTEMFNKIISAQGYPSVCIMDTEGNYLAGEEMLCQYFDKADWTAEIKHVEVREHFADRLISGLRMTDMPFVVICSTQLGRFSIPIEITFTLIFLLLSFFAAIFIASSFIARDVARPIANLSEAMEKTKESGWMEKIDVSMPENELGILADSYNSMIEYLNDLFTKLLEKEKSVQRAEMRVLHEQIKPHFLYNSMETISYMALEANAKDVHDALETLGSFYRNFLSKGDREIPLKREINIIKDYLSLQKLRYGDILTDEYDISEETLEYMIPKLLLQPLVENSIYHGIRLTGEPGVIKITSRKIDDNLHIYVYDSGVGMTEEEIESILAGESETRKEGEGLSGFGLRGTIDRVRYYCDSFDVVKIRSEVGEFTEIELILPII